MMSNSSSSNGGNTAGTALEVGLTPSPPPPRSHSYCDMTTLKYDDDDDDSDNKMIIDEKSSVLLEQPIEVASSSTLMARSSVRRVTLTPKNNSNNNNNNNNPIELLSSDDDDEIDDEDIEATTIPSLQRSSTIQSQQYNQIKHLLENGEDTNQVDKNDGGGKAMTMMSSSPSPSIQPPRSSLLVVDDDNDSSYDSDDSDFLNDERHVFRQRAKKQKKDYWWLSSSSSSSSSSSLSSDETILRREERLNHLEKNVPTNNSNNDNDKALQLLLWEIGFNYNIKPHQFEAIRFVAGVQSTFPNNSCSSNNDNKLLLSLNDMGVSARLDALRSVAAATTASSASGSKDDNDNIDNNNSNNSNNIMLPTRGMLLADEMGLGKTIEALAGAALRNAIMQHQPKQQKQLPTLIVSPQDGIQNQWYETLIKSGVQPIQITIIGETKASMKERTSSGSDIGSKKRHGRPREQEQELQQTGRFLLCTRHKVASELKQLFKACTSSPNGGKIISKPKPTSLSVLFSDVPLKYIEQLRNQYLSDKGKERNKFKNKEEKGQDCVARLVCCMGKSLGEAIFQTTIVDEAHFCKNVLAYWGLGLALLGTRSKRIALLTGTPYNNGPSDMSSLMTYIDPGHKASRIGWWKDATAQISGHAIKEAVRDWRDAYMLRRTKTVLKGELPPRSKINIDVACYASELWIYEAYEAKFLKALKQMTKFIDNPSPEARKQMMQVFQIMMACMANMRMSLIHPAIPGGREMTIRFSPSRKQFLKREEKPKVCVLCSGSNPSRVAEKLAAEKKADHVKEQKKESEDDEKDERLLGLSGRARTNIDLDDEKLDDNDKDLDDNDDSGAKSSDDDDKGPIVALESDICRASESGCRHFAHEKCIETHRKQDCAAECPRCIDLEKRIHMEHSRASRTIYCKETTRSTSNVKGFTASAKIEEAIKWVQTAVPKNDKAIILSFFKGGLDLIEGILTNELGIECARYDGDINKKEREEELDKFKTTRTCRVLLASVQSGGTGLNITEANHVLFLDRWFNPCVHDQAESRVHRLGQKKEVKIAYLDCNQTVDVVMKRINVLKEGNASVLLADGTSLGMAASGLGYRDLSGVIGNNLRAIKEMRCSSSNDNETSGDYDAPLPPHSDSDLETKLEMLMSSKSVGPVKREETKRNDHLDNLDNLTNLHNSVDVHVRQQIQSTAAYPGFDSIYNAVIGANKLPSYLSDAKNIEYCVICSLPGNLYKLSTCGHFACFSCWQQWLSRTNTCPQCRKPANLRSLIRCGTQSLPRMNQNQNGSRERERKPKFTTSFRNPYNTHGSSSSTASNRERERKPTPIYPHLQPHPVHMPLIPSSVSHAHKPNVIQTKSPVRSPAAQFFHHVKSTMTRDEFKSIREDTLSMKKYAQPKHRKQFMGAARGIIQIILNHENVDNRSTKQKPELLVPFLQLLPNHFVKDVEQLTTDLINRKSKIRNELRSAVPSPLFRNSCVIRTSRAVPSSTTNQERERKLDIHCRLTNQQHQQSYVLPRLKPTPLSWRKKPLLIPKHSKTVTERVADKKKRNLDNLKMSRLKRQKTNYRQW